MRSSASPVGDRKYRCTERKGDFFRKSCSVTQDREPPSSVWRPRKFIMLLAQPAPPSARPDSAAVAL